MHYSKNSNKKNSAEGLETRNSPEVLLFKGLSFFNKGFGPFGPFSQDPEGFLFKGFGGGSEFFCWAG